MFIAALVVLVPLLLILHLTGFWHAFPQMLLLGGIAWYSYHVVGEAHDHRIAVAAAIAVPAAILALALWRSGSGLGMWIADGAMAAAVCLKWLALGASVIMLLMMRLDVGLWLRQDGALPVLALAGWGAEQLLIRARLSSIRREARRMGSAS